MNRMAYPHSIARTPNCGIAKLLEKGNSHRVRWSRRTGQGRHTYQVKVNSPQKFYRLCTANGTQMLPIKPLLNECIDRRRRDGSLRTQGRGGTGDDWSVSPMILASDGIGRFVEGSDIYFIGSWCSHAYPVLKMRNLAGRKRFDRGHLEVGVVVSDGTN